MKIYEKCTLFFNVLFSLSFDKKKKEKQEKEFTQGIIITSKWIAKGAEHSTSVSRQNGTQKNCANFDVWCVKHKMPAFSRLCATDTENPN